MQGDDLLEEDRLGAGDVLDGLPRHGIRQEADEIAGMPGLERDADLAVGLEAADPGAVPGARIDDDERPAFRIDLDARRRNDADERIVDRPRERAAVDDELDLVVEHVRRGLGEVLAVLIAALAHDIPEQDTALRGVDHVIDSGGKHAKGRRVDRGNLSAVGCHGLRSLFALPQSMTKRDSDRRRGSPWPFWRDSDAVISANRLRPRGSGSSIRLRNVTPISWHMRDGSDLSCVKFPRAEPPLPAPRPKYAQPHFSVMPTSPGIPPGKSMISTLNLYPRSRKYFAQS